MIKVNWDVEELVALIGIYRREQIGHVDNLEQELINLSMALNRRADRLGSAHDAKFRELNGMKLMYQNVEYIATKGVRGMSSASASMKVVYALLQKCPEAFQLILNEFMERYMAA